MLQAYIFIDRSTCWPGKAQDNGITTVTKRLQVLTGFRVYDVVGSLHLPTSFAALVPQF